MWDDTAQHGPFNDGVFESELSPKEIPLRERFISEYLKDFDAFRAAQRAGFHIAFCADWAKRLMSEVYVQRRLMELTQPVESDEKQAEIDRLANMQRLRQIRDDPLSKPLERSAAIRELNSMRGFNKPEPTADAESALIDVMKDFAQRAPV